VGLKEDPQTPSGKAFGAALPVGECAEPTSILVHEARREDKAGTGIACVEEIPQMQAAGWGGASSVMRGK